jgi:hypothetical protein
MTLELLKQLHPELSNIVKAILPPNVEYTSYNEEASLLDLLPEALANDPGIDTDDAEMLLRLLMWIEHPMIILYVDSAAWVGIKRDIISKNKFLDTFFNKSKLRRSSIHNIHNYFQICPSLICIDTDTHELWNSELQKVIPDEKLAQKIRKDNPGLEFLGTPSMYDIYDSEARVLYVNMVSKILHTALKAYIEKYHPSLTKE